MIISLKSKCPHCKTVRVLWGPFKINNDDDLTAAETLIDIKGGAKAVCPNCNIVESVALFADGSQTEDWINADAYETQFGKAAGELPPRPQTGKRLLLGKILKERREELNLTQQQLADKTGLRVNTIQGIEQGKFWINLRTFFLILESLKLKMEIKKEE